MWNRMRVRVFLVRNFVCAYLEHYGIHAQKPPQTVETGHVSLANNAVGSL